jgi:ABC-2 type transport system permease protein
VDRDIRDLIRSGNVVYELLRPLDLYAHWFYRALAFRSAPTLLRSVPLLVGAGLFLGLQLPASWGSAGAFLLSILGALVLSCAITTLLNISLLWTVSGDGMRTMVPAVVIVFSGMIVPLPLFPEWAQAVLDFLPFRGLADVPYRLYTGHIPASDVLPLLLHQLAWSLAFIALGRWVLSRGTRRLVVQGG